MFNETDTCCILCRMKSWQERVKDILRQKKMTHAALAEILGITTGAVGHYLRYQRSPSMETIYAIADALEIKREELLFGAKEESASDALLPPRSSTKLKIIPLFTWYILNQSTDLKLSIVDYMTNGQMEYIEMPVMKGKEFGKNVFAIPAIGDAMYSPYPTLKSIVEGEILCFDPDAPLENGEIVLVRTPDGFIVREYSLDGTFPVLKAFNDKFKNIEVGENKIEAVLVYKGADMRGNKK